MRALRGQVGHIDIIGRVGTVAQDASIVIVRNAIAPVTQGGIEELLLRLLIVVGQVCVVHIQFQMAGYALLNAIHRLPISQLKMFPVIPIGAIEVTGAETIAGIPFRPFMVHLGLNVVLAPHPIDTLAGIQPEATTCLRSAHDVIQHRIHLAIAQARIVMILNTDNIRWLQGLDLLLLHLHTIDAQLHRAIAHHLDRVIQRIHLDAGQHQLLQQLNAIARSLHLSLRGKDQLPVRAGGLGRATDRHPGQGDRILAKQDLPDIRRAFKSLQVEYRRLIADTRDH